MFKNLGDAFGLDSYVIIEIAKGFATHLCVPKSGVEVYIEPVKQSIVVPKVIKQAKPVSSMMIEEYVEPLPFPNQVKENLLIAVTNRSNRRCSQPYEQVDVNTQISVIKQLNEENHVDVYLCEDATKVIKGNSTKVGKPVICSIGTSSYHGLCDIGASISVIPYSLYLGIKPDIDPIVMEETGMTIQLANKDYISPFGIVRDVEVLIGKIKYPADFIVLGCPQDSFCPFIIGRPFLHTIGAEINLSKEKVFIKCAGEKLEFKFSKFADKHAVKEPLFEDLIETLTPIVVASTYIVERYMLNQDEPFNDEEKDVLEQILSQQPPIITIIYPT